MTRRAGYPTRHGYVRPDRGPGTAISDDDVRDLVRAGRAAYRAPEPIAAPAACPVWRRVITGMTVGDPRVTQAATAWRTGWDRAQRADLRAAGLPS